MGCVPNCVSAAKMPKMTTPPFFWGKIALSYKPLELYSTVNLSQMKMTVLMMLILMNYLTSIFNIVSMPSKELVRNV